MPKYNGEKTENRDELGRFTDGNPGGPGRPKGSENFTTKWRKFIEKVAEENDLSPEEIDEQLFRQAYKKAREGDYQFYRDIQDRVYGRPVQKNEHTGEGGGDIVFKWLGDNNAD